MSLRRFISRLKRHKWIHPQSVLLILVALFMLGLILFGGGEPVVTGASLPQSPASMQTDSALLINQHASSILNKLAITPTPTLQTPSPDEEQTDGLILAGALVVLVIVGGTLFSISRRK